MWKQREDAELAQESWGSLLKCPKCKDVWLHQGNVTVYERSEDAEFTTVIAQSEDKVVVTKFPSADTHNPSGRRRGMTIEFWCESCNDSGVSDYEGKPFYLAISQHKGNTFVEWVS